MSDRHFNLARMTTTTTGTGTVTVVNAVAPYVTFDAAGVPDGGTVTYTIYGSDGVSSEIGRGVYTTSTKALTRSAVLLSTNSNNPINLTGTSEVLLTAAAEDLEEIVTVGTVAELKALNVTKATVAILRDYARAGTFVWRTGDYTAAIAADPLGGIYLKADGVATSVGAWVREYDGEIMAYWFGILPGLGTDAAAALQAAIECAEFHSGNISAANSGPVVLDGGGGTYAISDQLELGGNVQFLVLQNFGLDAIDSGATNWISSPTDHTTAGNNAMLLLSGGDSTKLSNIVFDGKGIANGIHITGCNGPKIEDVWGYHYKQFGLCMYGGFQLRLSRCNFSQWRGSDTEYKVQADQTAYGVWTISKGDMEIVDCRISKNKYNIFMQGAANFRIYNCHVFNGSSDDLVQWSSPTNIRIEAGSNTHDIKIVGGYVDNGNIEIQGAATENMLIDGIEFYNNGARASLTEWIKLIPTSVDQSVEKMKLGGNNTYHYDAGTGASRPNIMHLGTDSGNNWDLNSEVALAEYDMRFVAQSGGQTVVQVVPGIQTVEHHVSNATGSFTAYSDATTGSVPPRAGAKGDSYVVQIGNGDRLTVKDDRVVFGKPYKTGSQTVASLPSAASIGPGAHAFVSDATSATFRAVLVGGGSNEVPVHTDSSNWRVG